ncbi:hypothetical protein CH252_22030 [Rhodococcus sp. 06-1477-1B]|nr:hypothetical protein CH252_22030 [Rhodococcus sp. 06-1477-1B]
MQRPSPPERIGAQAQRPRRQLDRRGEKEPGCPSRLCGEGDVDLGSRAPEELSRDRRPLGVGRALVRIEAREARGPARHHDRPDGRGRPVEHERQVRDVVADEWSRAPRVDPVRGQQHHPRAGRDALARGPRPRHDPAARGQCRQHGTGRARGEVVGDLDGERRMPCPPHESRSHGLEKRVDVALCGAVDASEAAHRGPARAGRQGRDDGVDPGGREG